MLFKKKRLGNQKREKRHLERGREHPGTGRGGALCGEWGGMAGAPTTEETEGASHPSN